MVFIRKILFQRLRASYVYIGRNFRFGRSAQGDYKLLQEYSQQCGFKLKAFTVKKMMGRPVSSTYIRALIKKGNLARAEKLLTRPVSILGSVVKGTARGRILGFPTANIDPHHEVIPPPGIYAVLVAIGKNKYKGACYIGGKRTFPRLKAGPRRQHIEVHIFNFKKDIYGEYLEIQFVKKIRPDRKFASAAALAGQIRKDVIYAKMILSRH